MNPRKLVVMSADALTEQDVPLLKTLPNFSAYWREASGVERLRSIYPTVTYPAHATLATGVYPDRHGVVDNSELHIGMTGEMPWNWFQRAIRTEDVFTAAKRAGLTTASVFWPVTGCHPDIDYLIAEYWPQSAHESCIDAFRRAGSSEEVIRQIAIPCLEGATMRVHPEADAFVVRSACEMIRRYQPDLLMLHPANVDDYRHKSGLNSRLVERGVCETDSFLGELVQATKDAGVFESTNFVLLSDHGQLDIRRVISLNVLLADHGLIEPGENGAPARWDAYAKSTGMSALVYLRDPGDALLRARVEKLLRHLESEGIYGISRVFTAEEARAEERLAGDFSFVVETDGFTAFGSRLARPLCTSFSTNDYRSGRATHGYLPDKGPQPVFYAFGPQIKPGITLTRRPLVDVAPTLAAILGAELPGADGAPMREILA